MHVGDVILGDQRGHVQLDLGPGVERPFEIGLLPGFQGRNGALQQFHVQVVADLLDLAALLIAEELARAANLEMIPALPGA